MITAGCKAILYRYTDWLWIFDENKNIIKFVGGDHYDVSNGVSLHNVLPVLCFVYGVSLRFNPSESNDDKVVYDFIEAD